MKVTITNNCDDYEFEVHAEGCRDLGRTEARAPFGHTWKLEVQSDVVAEVLEDVNEDLEPDNQWEEGAIKFHACSEFRN